MTDKKFAVLIVAAIAIACFTYAYSTYTKNIKPETPVSAEAAPDENAVDTENENLLIEKAVIEGFEAKKELITCEANLSEVITWDESWGDISLFHKSQKIKFFGTGIYVCDLSSLTKDDIDIDFSSMAITVDIPKPRIKNITIDESKTEYEDVDKGWLRFGEVRLKPEQYESMYKSVKVSMENQLKERSAYRKAEDSSVAAVKQIFKELLTVVNRDFTVLVKIDNGE